MADKLEDVGFWLPSEFLTEEDILMDNKENFHKYGFSGSNFAALHCFPSQFPYDYGSSLLSSPVESSIGSTETESDEEDSLLTELTRHLKISGTTAPTHNHEKGMVLSSSPQSTLTQVGSWSGRSTVSSSGSPNGPSQVCSPPTTPLGSKNDAWDLIYQAAGQVARLKVNAGDGPSTTAVLSGPKKWLLAPQPLRTSAGSTFRLGQWQQVGGDEMLKQAGCGTWSREVKTRWSYEQELSQHQAGRLGAGTGGWNMNGRGFDPHSCAWPSLQIQQGNQLKPRNLGFREGLYCADGYGYEFGFGSTGGVSGGGGGGGLKKERIGTGVFLPRRYGNINNPSNMSDSRKKPGSSHMLQHPTRAMPELNKIGSGICVAQPQRARNNLGAVTDYETLIARRNAILTGQERRSVGTEPSSMSHEICLPQEWTY